jgi:hypothetical protein
MSQFEQRENVKFYQNLGKSSSETFQMIKQQGRDSSEGDEHTGRPRTVRTELKIQEVATLVKSQRQQQGLAMALATKFCLLT